MNTVLKVLGAVLLAVCIVGVVLLMIAGYQTKLWFERQAPYAEATNYNAAVTSWNVRYGTLAASAKVDAIDVQAVNDSIRNVRTATGHANAILGNVNGNMPKINKAAFLLWKHADRTLGHLDKASADYTDRQNEIAAQTVATLKSTDELINHAKPTVEHLNSFTAHADATAGHVEHVADHYDKQLTAPKRWYQKLKDAGTAVAIWCGRHL